MSDKPKCVTLDPEAQQRINEALEEEDRGKIEDLGWTHPRDWLEHLKELGESLTDLRVDKGITLRDFAHKTNYTVSHISDVERGLLIPTKELLDAYFRPV